MADDEEEDLDELLDEVEKRFCRNVSVTCSARVDPIEAGKCGKDSEGQGKHNRATKPDQPVSSVADDIDALLEELLEEDSSDSQLKTQQFPKGAQVEKKLSSQSGGRKCCPVFVGGSSVTSGVGTPTSKRSCDQLRCTSCDFRVLTFDDCEWDSSCDYLFLRSKRILKEIRGTSEKKNNNVLSPFFFCSSRVPFELSVRHLGFWPSPSWFLAVAILEQHAGPSEAQSQAEEEERCSGVRLSVQLVLHDGADGPQGPSGAQMGLWEPPGLMLLKRTYQRRTGTLRTKKLSFTPFFI